MIYRDYSISAEAKVTLDLYLYILDYIPILF